MRGTGADQPVLVMMRSNVRGAKGLNCSADGMNQPIKGGVRDEGKVVRGFQANRLGSVQEGQSESWICRSGLAVSRGIREGLEEQSLQDLESDVVRELLPSCSPRRRDPESQWRHTAVGYSDGRRSGRPDGGEDVFRATCRTTLPS